MQHWSDYSRLKRSATTRTMTLIEGVGDEVTDFFIVVGVLCVGWIAWCSTNISDQPLIRTVLILQHRTRTRLAEFRVNSQNAASVNGSQTPETSNPVDSAGGEDATDAANEECPTPPNSASSEVPTEPTSPTPAAASEEVLIEAMDSFNNDDTGLLRRPVKISNTETTTTTTAPTATTATTTPASKNVGETESVAPNETHDENLSPVSENEITIKLKFMNDDQRLVTGRLKEMLGEFKRRHFQAELESQKRVRLVFNGQLLMPDSETLESFGLFNNCVVHCLVHQQRVPAAPASDRNNVDQNSSSIYTTPQSWQNVPADNGVSSAQNEWDLSKLLFSILTVILAFAWYSRYHYAQLFTATTTLALYALTAVFSLSVIGHFFPDQDSLRNIE